MFHEPYFFPVNGFLKQINLHEVLCLEANDNYVKIVTTHEIIHVRVTLDSLINQLPANMFIQIHRSIAVVVKNVDKICKDYLTLIQVPNEEIPIGKKYYQELIERIKIIEPTNRLTDGVNDAKV